jgi:hypothetical protein
VRCKEASENCLELVREASQPASAFDAYGVGDEGDDPLELLQRQVAELQEHIVELRAELRDCSTPASGTRTGTGCHE